MRACPLLLLLLLCLPIDVAGKRLLIFEDQTATALAQPEYREWKAQVAAEGWKIRVVPIARWNRSWATNDWTSLRKMRAAVESAQPDAILLFGSLPYLLTAGQAADGHEFRLIGTDAHLGCTNMVYTDVFSWGLEVGSNEPGDGFPDQLNGNFHVPVSRVDAAGLHSIDGAGSTFASGYLSGTQIYQSTDEGTALKNYLRCNIDYRRKVFAFAELGWIDSSWANASTITSRNLSVTWTTGKATASFAGATNRWAYTGFEWGLASPNFITAGGQASLFWWLDIYKSYHMEENPAFIGRTYLRRPLFPGWWSRPLALMTSWGFGVFGSNPYWIGNVTDTTAADTIRSALVQQYGSATLVADFSRHWVNGDLTLPCDPITQNPIGTTTATSIRIVP